MARENYPKQFKPAPASESLKGIRELLEKSGVSQLRQHSIEGSLRSVIRLFGYRPRETKENPATLEQLAEQVEACFQAGQPKEGVEFEIQTHLHSVHSNLKADAGMNITPLPEVPKVVALLLFFLFLLFGYSVQAYDNFNVTNCMIATPGGTNFLVQGWPTNTLSTKLTITGYTTNGAQITTNGYYLPMGTGAGLFVRNFSPDGAAFVASEFMATNNLFVTNTVQLVRSWADHPPVVIWDTNTGVIMTNDWESTPGITLKWTWSGFGPQTWGTNLDAYALGNCTYLGVYSVSNNGSAANTNLWNTNYVLGLQKNVKPRALAPGNF